MIITAQKGVSLDFDAAGRDAKSQSKELYLWGQTQDDGIKGGSIPLDLGHCGDADWFGCEDVTDRLAYLNYVQGALSYTLATEINKCVHTLKVLLDSVYNVDTDCRRRPRSRTAWKHVRDAEAALVPRRTTRQNFKSELARIHASGVRAGNADAKHQLEAQLKKAEADDAPLEKELDLLRRAAIKETEAAKWKAFRDVSEERFPLTCGQLTGPY